MIFHFFALAAVGQGISGGDRIFIEFARHWSKVGHEIHIYVWKEGEEIIKNWNLNSRNIHIHVINMYIWPSLGFLVNYFARIAAGISLGFSLKISSKDIVYSASDFWMDFLPALIIKFRKHSCLWLAGWYQTAPNPLIGFTEGNRKNSYRLTAALYWLSQLVAKPCITKWADIILVNNESEKAVFKNKPSSVLVVLGAVDLGNIDAWIKSHKKPTSFVYAAVFQGRLHPQKGVVELIHIWKKVTAEIPNAKLAIIGDGELRGQVEQTIKSLHLDKNIDMFGFLYDGPKKFQIFSKSQIVVHPAFFDSGGMATAEAMAMGLPAVGFNLKSYASYYPQGMTKVSIGDLDDFAKKVIELLSNKKTYQSQSQLARRVIHKDWSWEKRASQILSAIK